MDLLRTRSLTDETNTSFRSMHEDSDDEDVIGEGGNDSDVEVVPAPPPAKRKRKTNDDVGRAGGRTTAAVSKLSKEEQKALFDRFTVKEKNEKTRHFKVVCTLCDEAYTKIQDDKSRAQERGVLYQGPQMDKPNVVERSVRNCLNQSCEELSDAQEGTTVSCIKTTTFSAKHPRFNINIRWYEFHSVSFSTANVRS